MSPMFDKRPVINLLDDTPMYVLLEKRDSIEIYSKKLAIEREGKVLPVDTLPVHIGKHYLLTDSVSLMRDSSSFRRPDRFTVVISQRYLESSVSLEEAIHFLKEYYFRFNDKKGDVFFVR
jgi:hypothetical protein